MHPRFPYGSEGRRHVPFHPQIPQRLGTDNRVRMRLLRHRDRDGLEGGARRRGGGLWAGLMAGAGRGEMRAGSRAARRRWRGGDWERRGGDWEQWAGAGSQRTLSYVNGQGAVAASARRQVRKVGLGSWVGGGCRPRRSRALRAVGRAATRRGRGAPARARGPWLTR